MKEASKQKGSTLFIAITVASVAVAIAIGILLVVTNQVRFSQMIRQSQVALTAADSGIECALYWDMIHTGYSQSYFPTSSDAVAAGIGVAPADFCAGHTYTGVPTLDVDSDGTNSSEWVTDAPGGAAAATTTFWFSTWSADFHTVSLEHPCVRVDVGKWIQPVGPWLVPRTTIRSEGFNSCDPGANRRVSRGVVITY